MAKLFGMDITIDAVVPDGEIFVIGNNIVMGPATNSILKALQTKMDQQIFLQHKTPPYPTLEIKIHNASDKFIKVHEKKLLSHYGKCGKTFSFFLTEALPSVEEYKWDTNSPIQQYAMTFKVRETYNKSLDQRTIEFSPANETDLLALLDWEERNENWNP